MSRHCPDCGSSVNESSQFCDSCGLALEFELSSDQTTDLTSATFVAAGATRMAAREAMTRALIKAEDDPPTRPIPSVQQGETTKPAPAAAPVTSDPPAHASRDQADSLIQITDLRTGQTLQKRYRLDKILGKGGFGAVYLAMDTTLQRWCVVKQMLMPKVRSPERLERYRSNFAREANLLAQLNHPGHPNIPEIYDYFSDNTGSNYLVMKYIEGRSLKQMLDENKGPLPMEKVLQYAVDLCSALHYMHTHSNEPVMHRDIKPPNVLLGNDGRIWLVDFGLAKAQPVEERIDRDMTQALGSAGYTPLEQWLGDSTPASDIYALGATLHHLLTGLDPVEPFRDEFNIQKLQQMHGQFIPLNRINRQLPKTLEGIVASATGADPEQRPTALQLQQQLDVFVSGAKDAPLFTFKSGETAQTNGQLVDLCDRYPREAQGYLYRGDFERWFRLTNRNHLAEAAAQAIRQGRSQKDGLEQFLKLAVPNLFFRRLRRAGMQTARVAVQFGLITLIALLFVVISGSYLLRFVIQRTITSYDWNFYTLELDQINEYSELRLNQIARTNTEPLLDNIFIDLRPPHHVDVNASWGGVFLLELPLTVSLVDERPHLNLTEINGFSLYLITANISAGINSGINQVFAEAPVKITSLETNETNVRFRVEQNAKVPWNPPAGALTTTDSSDPNSAPGETTLLAVYNQLDQPIVLEIDGERWTIEAHAGEIIEQPVGAHLYTVTTADGQLTARGQKNWTSSAYKLFIGLDVDQSVNISNDSNPE